jgi:ERCC4-related helicase
MVSSTPLRPGQPVRSERFGRGTVRLDTGTTAIVRFEHGLEECDKRELQALRTLEQALEATLWDCPLEVLTRCLAESIQSTNDQWGVFARSRIELLPHQLWVCRQVLAQWPARWLVADDVGLGKTIEAGLILWALLARGLVKRLLILCPASLVEQQWQERLRTMFDIRLFRYVRDADTDRSDFWGTHNQVVASLQTLRSDHGGRHDRLFEGPPWDLLIVDEAHHLNADEEAGPTQGYKLVQRLVNENRVLSMLFFTGTPHRGKDFGFLSLLRLLRSEFDPRRPMQAQLALLPTVMIRNNKQNVTDLQGRRLFHAPAATFETYHYSAEEEHFYRTLTAFILAGKAYASALTAADSRLVILVLITMQKLASSSVAAIRRALKRRLAKLAQAREGRTDIQARRGGGPMVLEERYREAESTGDDDVVSTIEEGLIEDAGDLPLMEDEEPRLRELVKLADLVRQDTKLQRILDIIEERFADRQVLLFTEYKATQAAMMSALMRRFGRHSVAFINGDNEVEDLLLPSGEIVREREARSRAAERFNSGAVRFLVSTEAGGEGIDLQERCHSLVHVDLPWNPMRLHQRVGRLNRHGQTQRVDVISLRNPNTVESLIWEKLTTKLDTITLALRQVMEEPEDLLQLVLGMTSPSLFREIFGDAPSVPRESLSQWFDEKTGRLGGRDAVEAVRDLVGHCAKFDYQAVSPQLPRVDLPALRPFFVATLALNGRRPREDAERLSFHTPEAWLREPGMLEHYDGVIFARQRVGSGSGILLGIGHKVFDRALREARLQEACVATIRRQFLQNPLFVVRATDRLTSEHRAVQAVIVGVEVDQSVPPRPLRCLRDWELIERLNDLTRAPGVRLRMSPAGTAPSVTIPALEVCRGFVEQRLESLPVSFRHPTVEAVAVLWPEQPTPGGTDEVPVPGRDDEEELE